MCNDLADSCRRSQVCADLFVKGQRKSGTTSPRHDMKKETIILGFSAQDYSSIQPSPSFGGRVDS
jgi:hypothetical protein